MSTILHAPFVDYDISAANRVDATWLNGVQNYLARLPTVCDAPYSAVGDGSTDDTAALEAAFAAGVGVLPPGKTFKITRAVSITTSNLAITCPFGQSTINQAALDGGTVIGANSLHLVGVSNVVIWNVAFTCNATALYQNSDPTADLAKDYAIRLSNTAASPYTPCTDIRIEQCKFTAHLPLLTEQIAGLTQADYTSDLQYYRIKFLNNSCYGTLTQNNASLYCSFMSGSLIAGNTIKNVTNASGILNLLGGTAGGGVYFNAVNNEVIGNICDSTRFGLVCVACDGGLLEGNTLVNMQNECIDHESSKSFTVIGNKLRNVSYAFAFFYAFYGTCKISNNHVELAAGATYALNHSPLTATTISAYGSLTFENNTIVCPDGKVLWQLSYCQNLVFNNNTTQNVFIVYAGDCYTQVYDNNTMLYDRLYGGGVVYFVRPADFSSSNQLGVGAFTNNRILPSVDLDPGAGALSLAFSAAFPNQFLVENNYFGAVHYGIVYATTAASDANNRTLVRRNTYYYTADATHSPFAIGGGVNCASLLFENLTTRTGLDVWGSTANFATAQGSGGAAAGSVLRVNNPTSGQPWEYVNVGAAGAISWKISSTLS